MYFTRTPVRAILAGSARDGAHYDSLVKHYGVGDRVEIKGFVSEEEMLELYSNALGVCYLPFDEDYGYVTLEGMLSSKPVVVPRDGGGAAELGGHDSGGPVSDPEPRAGAHAIDRL